MVVSYSVAATGFITCYDIEVVENRVHVFYGSEKREVEILEIYGRDISPGSSHCVSDL